MSRLLKAGKKWTGVEFYESKAKRHNGKADCCFYIRFRDARGKEKREKIGWASEGYTPQLASQVRAERTRTVRHGEELPNRKKPKLILNEVADKYFKDRGPFIKGMRNDQNRWQNHLEKSLGPKTVDAISQLDVDRIRIGLRNQGKSTGTFWNVMELARRIINYGAERNLCPNLSFKLKLGKRSNEKTELLTPEQWGRVLAVLDEYPEQSLANMVRVALFGGLRKSEIFNLKWSDVDFRNRVIHIRDPKSGEAETIPMNNLLYKTLKDHPKAESEYVFPGRGGKRRTESRIADSIKKMAGLPKDFRPWHGLRHAFASSLAESGKVDLYHLQKLLRHRSPQMTQRYAHLRNETLLRASNVLDAVASQRHNDETATVEKMQKI